MFKSKIILILALVGPVFAFMGVKGFDAFDEIEAEIKGLEKRIQELRLLQQQVLESYYQAYANVDVGQYSSQAQDPYAQFNGGASSAYPE